jgi:hypothetical protein
MRHKLFLLAAILGLSALATAQPGSRRDLNSDRQRLRQLEFQLQQDRNRLAFDRRHHASRAQIRADEDLVYRDRADIRRLKDDMRRDRELRRRGRGAY